MFVAYKPGDQSQMMHVVITGALITAILDLAQHTAAQNHPQNYAEVKLKTLIT